MKITQIFCDKCKTLIQEKTYPGGEAGIETGFEKQTIEVWSDAFNWDLVFCTVDCLKEYVKNVSE